ncbi:MAG TPA: AAA family ATPase [Caldimonas sp.]|jgi:nicotinamide riboside kinase|nr:AAA family ATPase [Caldimonas sp.]HEX2540503.1 AAA family ATPase [Caldimonas sp.]
MTRAFVVALLGAESTGKTTLARDLGTALGARGENVIVVAEYLREFCDARGRTPRRDEQRAIAAEQSRRIEAAAAQAQVVVADTTALMIAVYSEIVFGDRSLFADAEQAHRRCDLTLLTALDLAWMADGLQRDGPHVRTPVDERVQAALRDAGLAFTRIAGVGSARLENALRAVDERRRRPS